MGNTASTKQKKQEQKQRQEILQILSDLGDTYPFGDTELLRLQRTQSFICHLHYHHNHNHHRLLHLLNLDDERLSFLQEWVICSFIIGRAYQETKEKKKKIDDGEEEDDGILSSMFRKPIMEEKDVDSLLRNYANDGEVNRLRRIYARIRFVEEEILPVDFESTLKRLMTPLSSSSSASSNQKKKKEKGGGNDSSSPTSSVVTESSSSTSFCGSSVLSSSSFEHLKPNNNNKADGPVITTWEETKPHLESFLEGLSNCGRRGQRTALETLFRFCSSHENEPTAAIMSPPTMTSRHNHQQKNGDSTVVIMMADADDLIDLSYRLALAGSYLSGENDDAGSDDDDDRYKPKPKKDIQMLSRSLIEFSNKKKKKREEELYGFGGGGFDAMGGGGGRGASCNGNATNIDSENMISQLTFIEWCEATSPMLSSSLTTLWHWLLFSDMEYPPNLTQFVFPNLVCDKKRRRKKEDENQEEEQQEQEVMSGFFETPSDSLSDPLLFGLACMSPSLGGMWYRLFTSDTDGMSFNRLLLSLLGYNGPTLLIIRSTNDGIFGAFTSSSWKESKDFYGNSDCFLYRLHPSINVYRPRGGNGGKMAHHHQNKINLSSSSSDNFMYCNSEARSRGYDGLAHGIGFGGTSDQPRLFISESLEDCCASPNDLTFESGPLLPSSSSSSSSSTTGGNIKYFDIDTMEAWAVGGNEAVRMGLEARSKQRDIADANLKKARKVDKAQFLDDFKSGLIESKAFQHRDQIRGRAGECHVDDNDTNNYIYEK